MLLKTGRTAVHHGRYGETDFALLLALQEGTAGFSHGLDPNRKSKRA
jgi:hypothetical protein